MPTEIRIRNFPDQTGETEAVAAAALQAVDADVLIRRVRVHDNVILNGVVISQDVENIEPEAFGGAEESRGVRVTLTISLGRGTWFESTPNELEAEKLRYNPFRAVDFDFPSGHVRLWTGYGPLTISGEIYLGMGELGRISNGIERANLTTERRSYQLSGAMVDPAVVSEEDIDGSFGRTVIEMFGFLDPDTHQLIDTPETAFRGEISNIRRVDGREPLIEVNAENRLAVLDKPNGWRYTHQHQQRFYEGDMGCEPAARLNRREILWGGHRVHAGIPASGGRGGGGRPRTQPP